MQAQGGVGVPAQSLGPDPADIVARSGQEQTIASSYVALSNSSHGQHEELKGSHLDGTQPAALREEGAGLYPRQNAMLQP